MFVHFRESESAHGEGEDRGGQSIPSGLCTDSSEPDVGLELTSCEIMTWAEVGCLTDWAIQMPLYITILIEVEILLGEGGLGSSSLLLNVVCEPCLGISDRGGKIILWKAR